MKYRILNFIRELALILLVVWTVVSLVTLLIELVPGTPATAILGETATPEQIENFNRRHGLDKPAFFISVSSEGLTWNGIDNRYADYWSGLLQGDLGRSFRTDRPVFDMIIERYPSTTKLALASMLVAVGIAIPLCVFAGYEDASEHFGLDFSGPGFCLGFCVKGFCTVGVAFSADTGFPLFVTSFSEIRHAFPRKKRIF